MNTERLTTCIKHLAVSGLSCVSDRIKSSCNLIVNRFEMPNVSYTQPLPTRRRNSNTYNIMKQEKLIVGLILTAVGLVLLYIGYQKIQPDTIETGIKSLNEFSRSLGGEEIPEFYKKDKSGAIILLLLGSIASITGLWFILKSGKQNN